MNKRVKYIAVDTGKSNTKYAWFDQGIPDLNNLLADSFKSVVEEVTLDGLSISDNLVTYEGTTYDVGGMDERVLESSNSKLSNEHRMCIYTAVAKALLRMNIDINETHYIDLSINVPLKDFKNMQEEYIAGYQGKAITLKLNNQTIGFMIDQVRLAYEGSGAFIRNTEIKTTNIHVVDIGGKNDTHVSFEGCRPVKGKNGMTNNGVLSLLQHVASDLSSDYDVTIDDVEKIIFGKLTKPDDFDGIFERHAKQHVKMIKNQVQKYRLNRAATTIVFSGGGSMLLKQHLKFAFAEYNIVFAKDAQFDNTKGMLEKILHSDEVST